MSTMFFIWRSEIPDGRKPSYLQIVATDWPNKEQTKWIRFTVGGNQIDYPGEASTKTSQLTMAKTMLQHNLCWNAPTKLKLVALETMKKDPLTCYFSNLP